jgi:hypothetical protein
MNFADIERTINEFGEKVNKNLIIKSREIRFVFLGKERFTFN